MHDSPKIAVLTNEVEDLSVRMDELEKRLTAYDLLAAKWGGVCMVAMSFGAVVFTYYQNIKSYLIALWGVK